MPRWTEGSRKKQSELIQNWKPWEHSTGATSSEGKAKSAMNALKYDQKIERERKLLEKAVRRLKKLGIV